MYYVRREGRIKGPLTREKLRSLRQERRLRLRDEVPRFDSGIWSDDPAPMPLADEEAAVNGEPDREWHESLQTWLEGEDPFRKPFRPWMYVLGVVFLLALAFYAMVIVLHSH